MVHCGGIHSGYPLNMDARQEMTTPPDALVEEKHPGGKVVVEHTVRDRRPSEEAHLSEYDKEIADSFPASDPPAQP
jgi:hypothetical protein